MEIGVVFREKLKIEPLIVGHILQVNIYIIMIIKIRIKWF